MGIIMESSLSRQELLENAFKISEIERDKNKTEYYSDYEKILALKESALESKEKKALFSSDVSIHFLELALQDLYFKSFKPSMLTENVKNIGANLIHNFVKEEGALNILSNMPGKSLLLSEIYRLVDKYHTIVMEKVDPDDEYSYDVSDQSDQEFYDELEKSDDIEDITNTIRLRVANAEEQFMQSNIEDKEKINDIIRQASNITAVSDDDDSTNPYPDEDEENEDDDESEEAENKVDEATMMVNGYISDIKQMRDRTVFEQMVMNISESVMKDEKTKVSFTESVNDRLDMYRIVESARSIYTLLEMLETCKIKHFDEAEILDTLNNL